MRKLKKPAGKSYCLKTKKSKMAELKVLIEGYAKEGEDYESASSTTVLIKDGKLNIIVDPGMNRKFLMNALKKENLMPKDIDYVILSHYHLDHSLLTGIFENAKIIYANDIYSFEGKISERGKIFSNNIEIIKTPGHNSDCRTILVKTEKGVIAICEDVFWWRDNEKQKIDEKSLINHEDPYATDKEKLKASRKKLLEVADYIIPGHGKMFKVNK